MLRILSSFLLLSMSSAWVIPNRAVMVRNAGTAIHSESSEFNTEVSNPCWQDIYDADCTMDSIFSARFVASEWIKELPCARGMEVSLLSSQLLGVVIHVNQSARQCLVRFDSMYSRGRVQDILLMYISMYSFFLLFSLPITLD